MARGAEKVCGWLRAAGVGAAPVSGLNASPSHVPLAARFLCGQREFRIRAPSVPAQRTGTRLSTQRMTASAAQPLGRPTATAPAAGGPACIDGQGPAERAEREHDEGAQRHHHEACDGAVWLPQVPDPYRRGEP